MSEVINKGRRFRKIIYANFFIHPKDVLEIPIFLAIEKEVIEIMEKKFMENLLEVDDYQGASLESAIERATGNQLTEIEDDHQFEKQLEELKRHYRSFYYRVAYKLPTIRILPFILRLITF